MSRKRRKMSRWWRLLPWALLGLCMISWLGILIALAALPSIINAATTRLLAEHHLAPHVSLTVCSISLSGATLGPIALQDELGEVSIDSVILRYTPRGLLRGHLQSLTLSSIQVTVIEKDGEWVVPGLEWIRRRPSVPSSATASSRFPRVLPAVSCAELNLRGGTLQLRSGEADLLVPFAARATVRPDHTVTGEAQLNPLWQSLHVTFSGTPLEGNFVLSGHAEETDTGQLHELRKLDMMNRVPTSPWPLSKVNLDATAVVTAWSLSETHVSLDTPHMRIPFPQTDVVLSQVRGTFHIPANWLQTKAELHAAVAPISAAGITVGGTELSGQLNQLSASLQTTPFEVSWGHVATAHAELDVHLPFAQDGTPQDLSVSAHLRNVIYKDQSIGGIEAQITGKDDQFAFTVTPENSAASQGSVSLEGSGTLDLTQGVSGAFAGTAGITVPDLLTALELPGDRLQMAEPLSLHIAARVNGESVDGLSVETELEIAPTTMTLHVSSGIDVSAEVAGTIRSPGPAALSADLAFTNCSVHVPDTNLKIGQLSVATTIEGISPTGTLTDVRVQGKASLANGTFEVRKGKQVDLSGEFAGQASIAGTPVALTVRTALRAGTCSLRLGSSTADARGLTLETTANHVSMLGLAGLRNVNWFAAKLHLPPEVTAMSGRAAVSCQQLCLSGTPTVRIDSLPTENGVPGWGLQADVAGGHTPNVTLSLHTPPAVWRLRLPEKLEVTTTGRLNCSARLTEDAFRGALNTELSEFVAKAATADGYARTMDMTCNTVIAQWRQLVGQLWLALSGADDGKTGNPIQTPLLPAPDALRKRIPLEGRIEIHGGKLTLADNLTLAGVSLSLPFATHGPSAGPSAPLSQPEKLPGAISIGTVHAKGEDIAGLEGSCAIVGDAARMSAQVTLRDLPATISAVGEAQWLPPFRAAGKFTLPPVDLTTLAPFKALHPKLDAVGFSGTVSAQAALAYGLDGATGMCALSLRNGNFSMVEKGISIGGIESALVLDDLPRIRTAPHQKITFTSLQLNELVLGGGEITYHLQSLSDAFLEKCRLDWFGGRLVTHAVRFDPQKPDFDVTLFLDNISLGEATSLLKSVEGKAQGTLYGKLPLAIRNGRVSYNDGFLYSVPGEKGGLQLAQADLLTKNVPSTAPNYKELKLAEEALRDFEFSLLRFDLRAPLQEAPQLRLRLDGRSVKNPLLPPVRLDVNVSGALQDYINMALRMSGH